MLNQLGSGSISCLRPAVETEHLVWSNERRDYRPFFPCEPTITGHVGAGRMPTGTCFQPSIIRGSLVQHFLIDGLDGTDQYVGHHVHWI